MSFELATPSLVRRSALFGRGRTLRYELRRWWVESPKRWAAWLMLNPSNADAGRDDPTALRVTHFTQSWGYDGWIGVNLYPFISSDPKHMWAWSRWQENGQDWYTRDDLLSNLQHIETVARYTDLRVVAFGAEPTKRDQGWLRMCLEAFAQCNAAGSDALYCLGVNKDGQPLHPMARGKWRVPDNAQPVKWSEFPEGR